MILMIAREDGTSENVRHKDLVAVQSPDSCMAEQAASFFAWKMYFKG